MKLARFVLTITLLLFVGATVGTLIAQETLRSEEQAVADAPVLAQPGPVTSVEASNAPLDPAPDVSSSGDAPSQASVPESPAPAQEDPGLQTESALLLPEAPCVVEAVYFHNTTRCVTCRKIEGDAKAIVDEVFAVELAAGTLRWSAVNMEEQREAISQYDLVSPSLVLIRKVGDQIVDWVTLTETWNLVRSTTRFSTYIVDSFNAFLEGCP
jgi:hypothetical protein